MGFYLNVLLLQSHQRDFGTFDPSFEKKVDRRCVMWEIEVVLNLQRISAPVNDAGFSQKTAKERAALHFFDSLYEGLTTYVNKSGKECLAPPFAILKEYDQTLPPRLQWEKQFVAVPEQPNQFIQALSASNSHQQIPPYETMVEHNDALPTCEGLYDKADIVFERPLVWAPCELLAQWIVQRETIDTAVKLKKDDREAAAFFAMWKSSIVEMGKVGALALFLFENIDLPSVL